MRCVVGDLPPDVSWQVVPLPDGAPVKIMSRALFERCIKAAALVQRKQGAE